MPVVAYKIIYADGREFDGTTDLPDAESDPRAEKMWAKLKPLVQDVIGAGNDIEHVNVWHDSRYLDMFVDETGVEKELPLNEKATKIYRANTQAHEPNPEPEDEMPTIHGDVVLFMEKVWR